MEDFLPIILSFIAILTVIFGGLIIYTLSFFVDFRIALSLVLAVFSIIIGSVIYFFAPNFDNADAVLVARQVILIVVLASILVISGNLFKAFAIF